MTSTLKRTALLFVVLTLGGCDGDDNSAAAEDPVVLDDPASCTVPGFDVAEMLFTESDRQWYCTVEAGDRSAEDEVFFRRDGQAEMTRFREVYWNRSLADDSIRVASPFITPFTIRDISSSNTVLKFSLIRDSGESEEYDCVLVGRETEIPGLL